MEEGRQKSKRLSYTSEFKREVIRCAEEKRNQKAAAIFGVDESNVQLWQEHKAAISGYEASQRKFIGPKKGRFREIDDAVYTFFSRESQDWTVCEL
jgi:transposase-like protein